MLLAYYIFMSLADASMSKKYFKNRYFCKDFFVVETFVHFKISKKQNQQIDFLWLLYILVLFI